jgi:hypothetical protein
MLSTTIHLMASAVQHSENRVSGSGIYHIITINEETPEWGIPQNILNKVHHGSFIRDLGWFPERRLINTQDCVLLTLMQALMHVDADPAFVDLYITFPNEPHHIHMMHALRGNAAGAIWKDYIESVQNTLSCFHKVKFDTIDPDIMKDILTDKECYNVQEN